MGHLAPCQAKHCQDSVGHDSFAMTITAMATEDILAKAIKDAARAEEQLQEERTKSERLEVQVEELKQGLDLEATERSRQEEVLQRAAEKSPPKTRGPTAAELDMDVVYVGLGRAQHQVLDTWL